MSYKITALIILFGSSLGLSGIIARKIPLLAALPEIDIEKEKESLRIKLGRILTRLNPFENPSYEVFLQKILTKIRILSLKTDNKTANLLQRLRENAQKKKIKEDDNYWQEIKKGTKKTDF